MHDFHYFLLKLGGVLYPQSTLTKANIGARSYLKNIFTSTQKKWSNGPKIPYFYVAPFPPQLCTFLLLHTHQKTTLSSAVMTKVTWFLHRFELSSLIHETEKAFEDNVQYCIKEGLCYVSISQILQTKTHTHSWVVDAPHKISCKKRNKNSHSNHFSIFLFN